VINQIHNPAIQGVIGSFRDVTERVEAEQALHASQQRLIGLSARLVNAQEDERRLLAYELHDEIGQRLTGLNMALEIGAQMPADQVRVTLREAQQLVAELTSQVRRLSLDLRPPMIDQLGLLATLQWLIERYTQQTGVVVDFKYSALDSAQPPHIAIVVYRIVQEGLTNIARHAQTSAALVRVWTSAGQLKISIEDQGCGFDTAITPLVGRSLGLASMYERVQLLGGRFNLDSTLGEGTRIRVTLPLDAAIGI
jgi:signal transduction histidine kinase